MSGPELALSAPIYSIMTRVRAAEIFLVESGNKGGLLQDLLSTECVHIAGPRVMIVTQ